MWVAGGSARRKALLSTTEAGRDEPARFGYLRCEVYAPTERVGSLVRACLTSAISRDLEVISR